MPKIIVIPTNDYQWTVITSKELEERKYQTALAMAWDVYTKELEKSGAVTFDSKISLKELGQKFNELIQELRTRFKKDGKYTQEDIEGKIQLFSQEYGNAKQANNRISITEIFNNYDKNRTNLLKKVTLQIEYKDRIDEEIYKLHVNLPLEKNRDATFKVAKAVFNYLEKLIEARKIHSGKACAGLVEGTIDESDVQNRYLNAAQITIYLPKNINSDSVAEILENINKMAANQGITNMEPSKGDSVLSKGVVSLRCDFCDGQYVAFDEVSKDHVAKQELLPMVKQLREQKKLPDKEPNPSIFTKKKERPALQRTKAVRDLKNLKFKK